MPFIPFAAAAGTALGTTAGLGGAAVLAGATLTGLGIASAVKGLSSKPSMPSVGEAPKAPTIEDASIKAKEDQRKRAAARTQTILTGLGDQNLLNSPSVTGKTLLGG